MYQSWSWAVLPVAGLSFLHSSPAEFADGSRKRLLRFFCSRVAGKCGYVKLYVRSSVCSSSVNQLNGFILQQANQQTRQIGGLIIYLMVVEHAKFIGCGWYDALRSLLLSDSCPKTLPEVALSEQS